jgi:hypothetical protein
MDSTPQDFQALVISFILPDNEDLQPPQEEHSEELDSRYILYDDKMIELVDVLGNGLCLFYNVSSFLGDLLPQEKSSTPNAWVPFIGLSNSTRFRESKATLFLTKFHAHYPRLILMCLLNILNSVMTRNQNNCQPNTHWLLKIKGKKSW